MSRAPRDVLDRYYTPDALAVACVATLSCMAPNVVVEPSVGGGAFARAAAARWPGAAIYGVDVDPAAPGFADCHGFDVAAWGPDIVEGLRPEAELIVGNPPYRDAEEHVRVALGARPETVAFLLRLGFLAGQKRAALWRESPPTTVHVLSRRPSFTDGGTDATEYGWFVWDLEAEWRYGREGPPVLRWLSW